MRRRGGGKDEEKEGRGEGGRHTSPVRSMCCRKNENGTSGMGSEFETR